MTDRERIAAVREREHRELESIPWRGSTSGAAATAATWSPTSGSLAVTMSAGAKLACDVAEGLHVLAEGEPRCECGKYEWPASLPVTGDGK